MIPNRLPFVLLTTSVLASAVRAQTTPPCLDYAPTNTVEWPSPGYGDGSDFRRVVAGYFDGSGDIDGRDVAVRAGETVVYMTRPHNWTTSFALDLTPSGAERVVDIAVLPNGIASGKDGLLVTDPDGLHLVELEGGALFTQETLSADTRWQSATKLQVVDLDPAEDDGCEVFAVTTNGDVVVLDHTDSENPTTISFTPGGTVLDLEAAQWTTSVAGLELAVLTDLALKIFNTAGTLLRTFSHTSTTGQIARLQTGLPPDTIAWSRRVSGGSTSELVTVKQITVSTAEQTEFDLCISTFDVEPVTLTGGDYDGDGLDDLLLTHEQNETAIVWVNPGLSAFTNDPAAYDALPLTPNSPGSGTGNDSIPFFGDLNGDGRADIVHAVSTTQTVEVWTNASYARQAPADPVVLVESTTAFEVDIDGDGLDEGKLDCVLNNLPYEENTHFEVILFKQDSPDNVVNNDDFYHYVFPIIAPPGGWTQDPCIILRGLKKGDCWTDRTHFYMKYRFTDASGTSPYISFENSSPWSVGGLTLKNDCTAIPAQTPEELATYMMSNGGLAGLFGLSGPFSNPGGDPAVFGAYVPMSRVPPFQPGAVPVIQAAEYGDAAQPKWW